LAEIRPLLNAVADHRLSRGHNLAPRARCVVVTTWLSLHRPSDIRELNAWGRVPPCGSQHLRQKLVEQVTTTVADGTPDQLKRNEQGDYYVGDTMVLNKRRIPIEEVVDERIKQLIDDHSDLGRLY
jgi:hypothetical protein